MIRSRILNSTPKKYGVGAIATLLITLVVTLALVLPRSVFADNLVAGDTLLPPSVTTLAFGTVCANTMVSKSVVLAVNATGHNGTPQNNVFANSATVTVTVTSVSGSGLSADGGSPYPKTVGTITMPSNWISVSNQNLSNKVTSTVTLTSGTAGAFSGTVNYSASGAQSQTGGGTLTKTQALSVTATVVNCDTTPPTLSLPSNITAEATSASGAVVTYTVSATDANPAHPTVTCTPASGSTFALGATTVNCSATDAAGNTGTGSFTVTVQDTTKPTISNGPTNVTAEASGASGAVVTYTAPTATDLVDGTDPVTCTPASGSTFALGTTTVTCTSTDAHGNKATSTFTITVQDTIAPTLSLPSNITTEATGPNGAVVTFTPGATDLVDGTDPVTCIPASGSTFALGTTTVNCSATDADGNKATGSFTVTVRDTTPPTIAQGANVTAEASSASGAVVTYTTPGATDLVDGTDPVTCTPASGSTFPIGTTTVNCSATDAHGNTATSSFTVTVEDTTAPDLTLPSNITVEATGPTGAVVTYAASAFDLVDGSVPISCTPASGSTFSIAPTTNTTTTVNCSATDAHGNTATGHFTVTVQDTTPPNLSLPNTLTVEATGPSGAAVTYSASATDVVDGTVSVTCAPASGSTFPIGATTNTTTPVNCSATDAHGNTATGSFTVTVQDTTAPVLTLPSNITVEATGPNGAVVTYAASAFDLVDGSVTVTCDKLSGSTFPIDATTNTTTTVNCSATDAHGNTATGHFTVTVRDTTPPTIAQGTDVTAEATGPNGASVTYTTPGATDLVDGTDPVTCTPASGSTFALGTTTVNCSATDAHGNTATSHFTVTVVDTTPPALTLPADIQVPATSASGAVVTYSVTASDLVDGSVTPNCAPASGSTFPIGVTKVTCTATDAHGNEAMGSFTVQVTYQLNGFYQPVTPSPNAPTVIVWNTVKGGSTVPLKFEVFAGTDELTSTSVVQQPLTLKQINCVGGTQDPVDITSTGGTVLRYDTTAGQFVYNWQTPKQSGACYMVTVYVLDGSTTVPNSYIVAFFQLK